jgi:iron complex transport system substrate-binding protein
MKKLLNKPFLLYLTVTLFIVGWWFLAFHDSLWKANVSLSINPLPNEFPTLPSSLPLSSLNRPELASALRGNYPLIVKKIVDWDVDAILLENAGHTQIQRLPAPTLQRCHLLLRQMKSGEARLINNSKKYLPQTYVSAGILLTLLPPEAIAALPAGIRKSTQLYPEALTVKIPMNLDKFETEKLYMMKPEVAFVSNVYSDPNRIQALKNQGISVVFTSGLSTISDIQRTLELIGSTVGKAEEAELLSIFIEASLMAIENRLHATISPEQMDHISKHMLYLCYNTKFQHPLNMTVTHSLLQRLHLSFVRNNLYNKTTLAQEDLLQMNPDYLILSSSHKSRVENILQLYPALRDLKAIQQHNLMWLDDDVQQTPTHHVVLAYFDLVNALAHMRLLQ